jgi:hypothetical protein
LQQWNLEALRAGDEKISSSSSDMQARVNNYSRSRLPALKSDIAIKSAIAHWNN